MNSDQPTEFTSQDIDKFVENLMNSEIKEKKCATCGKGYYLNSYGYMFMECDECFFKRVPAKQKEQFFRSFLE